MYADRICGLPILLVAALALPAQQGQAEIHGAVLDPSGLGIPGAAIALEHLPTGRKWQTTAGEGGGYRFLALPTGRYRFHVVEEGFTPLLRDGVALSIGDRVEVNLTLAIGETGQAIEVTAAPPLLQRTRGTAAYIVDQRRVVTLPLDGRNFVPLLALAPGVNLPPGNLLPRINGSRPRVSEYIYDGISVLQPEPGQVAFYPVLDAIEEFRVETNSYSAEYGRSNGGVILVNQKAGGNDLHGTLFEFFRNERLNARNLFAVSGPKPRFRRNQYGFVLGGPIQRNRTFFFGDWQATELSTGLVRTSTVPTEAERAGISATPIYDPATTRRMGGNYARDPFPGYRIPDSRFDAVARTLAERYPLPNASAGGAASSANNYRRVGNEDTSAGQFDGRIDRYLGERHRVFGRYSYLRDDSRPTAPFPDGSGAIARGVISDTLTRGDGIAAEWAANLSPASVNQLRFGHTRRQFVRSAMRLGATAGAATGIPNLPLSSYADVLPNFEIAGLQQLGPTGGANAFVGTSVTQIADTLSWVRGSHSLKAGMDFRRERLNVLQPLHATGNFQFTAVGTGALLGNGSTAPGTGSSFGSFLLGQVGRFRIDSQPDTIGPRASIAELFVQDDWRATRRLSLNLGLRYTLNFPSTVEGDRGAVFDLDTEELRLLGKGGQRRSARTLEKANLGPRVGLALALLSNTVLRAGYGMTWIEQAGITTPFTTPLFPFIQTLGQESLDGVFPAFVLSQGPTVRPEAPGPDAGLGQGVFGVQRDNGSGYAQQWNLSLQRTLGSDWSFQAGYLGSKLTRLGVPDVNQNQLSVAQLAMGPALLEAVPNPYFGMVPATSPLGRETIPLGQLLRPYPKLTNVTMYRNNTGHSTYHSCQAHVEKRFSNGFTGTVSYTFSRLIDDAGAVFDSALLAGPVANFQVADSFNKRLEKDVSTGNIPQILSAGFVWELPALSLTRGWKVAGIARLQSGSPVAVTQAVNRNAFAGFGIQRPNRIGNPELEAEARSLARWFDTSAFTAAPQYVLGNSSRNPVTGPAYRTLDVMLGKTFRLTERLGAEFRAEAFNVTNTPPLGNPNGSFGTAAFGSISSALDPRVYEFVLKLQF